jgi:hypothetical protein
VLGINSTSHVLSKALTMPGRGTVC